MAEVERIVASELLRAESQGGTYVAPYYQILCWIRLISGDLQQLRHAAQYLLKESQRNRLMLSMTWAHYFLGLLRYEWNDLESAAAHFQTIAERRYSAHFTAAQESMLGLALIRHAQGSAQEARETTEALAMFNLEQAGSISDKTRSAQARLAEMQGNHESQAQWLGSVELSTPDRPIPLFDEPSMTRARVLIAENSAASLRQATQLLVQVREMAASMHNERRLIEVFAVQAMAFQALGQQEKALDALQSAVQMAHSGGFVRMFLDLGRPMRALLVMLEKRGIAPSYLQRLLAAFDLADAETSMESPVNGSIGRAGTGAGSSDGDSTASPASLLLTPRELEVLSLLDSPLSDKEIAARLFVTVNTVKRHTGSIYLKLGVHSRRRAVARAKKLRIELATIAA
jgi:LuxR family transcriptional regulator, maltose regulon positive regulatory protein